MKEQFTNYFLEMGVPEPYQARVAEIYAFYNGFLGWDINDVFLSEYMDGNARIFGSLWFFSENMVMEAKSFITEDTFDALNINKKFVYFEVRKKDFSMSDDQFTADSRLTIFIEAFPPRACNIQATQQNCIYLRNIFVKYIVPNLV